MTPEEKVILSLSTTAHEAFGIQKADVLRWLDRRHPALGTTPRECIKTQGDASEEILINYLTPAICAR